MKACGPYSRGPEIGLPTPSFYRFTATCLSCNCKIFNPNPSYLGWPWVSRPVYSFSIIHMLWKQFAIAWLPSLGSVQAVRKQPGLEVGAFVAKSRAVSEELVTTGMSYAIPEPKLPDRKCHRVFNRRCYSCCLYEQTFRTLC